MSLESRSKRLLAVAEADRSDEQKKEIADLLVLRQKQLEGNVIEVLDDGFVAFIDMMGRDADIAQAARVSYGAGTKSVNDDRNLIRYLMRHRHSTPLEMVELKFRVRVPMDCWRQWIRHRTANVNEYSTRYSEAIDSQQTTQPGEWRLQATDNKQGSSGFVTEWPEYYLSSGSNLNGPGHELSDMESNFQKHARDVYEERLKFGVAREQARKDLPLSTYTEAYWKIDLHNLFHFLGLRMDSHAQLEIRLFANAIGELVKPRVPAAWEAFEDYRLNGMSLSGLEISAIRAMVTGEVNKGKIMGNRELREFDGKLARLGLLKDESEAKAA